MRVRRTPGGGGRSKEVSENAGGDGDDARNAGNANQ